eukprot:TRINITY_DN605_c0_g2_i1.p1 TRINITY_DN605_c0_g2~~TRINITY_DN605_c0_g2_i1.p1  ORF type:complete len:1627 (-),score=286.22 TRINITY_DN605_c0_g2_i1:702-5582(-)
MDFSNYDLLTTPSNMHAGGSANTGEGTPRTALNVANLSVDKFLESARKPSKLDYDSSRYGDDASISEGLYSNYSVDSLKDLIFNQIPDELVGALDTLLLKLEDEYLAEINMVQIELAAAVDTHDAFEEEIYKYQRALTKEMERNDKLERDLARRARYRLNSDSKKTTPKKRVQKSKIIDLWEDTDSGEESSDQLFELKVNSGKPNLEDAIRVTNVLKKNFGPTDFISWYNTVQAAATSCFLGEEGLEQLIRAKVVDPELSTSFEFAVKNKAASAVLENFYQIHAGDYLVKKDALQHLLEFRFDPADPTAWFRGYQARLSAVSDLNVDKIKVYFSSVLPQNMLEDMKTRVLDSKEAILNWLNTFKTKASSKTYSANKTQKQSSKKYNSKYLAVRDKLPPKLKQYRLENGLCLMCGANSHRVNDCPHDELKNLNVGVGAMSVVYADNSEKPFASSTDDSLQVYTIEDIAPSTLMENTLEVRIRDIPLLARADTGLDGTSLIRKDVIDRLNLPFEETSAVLILVNQITVEALGSISLDVNFGEFSLTVPFLIVEDFPCPKQSIYLGSEWKKLVGNFLIDEDLPYWLVKNGNYTLNLVYEDNFVFAKNSFTIPARASMAVSAYAHNSNCLIQDLHAPDLSILNDELVVKDKIDTLIVRNSSNVPILIQRNSILARCSPIVAEKSSVFEETSIDDFDTFFNISDVDWDDLEALISDKVSHIVDLDDRKKLTDLLFKKFSKMRSVLDYTGSSAPDFDYVHKIDTGDAKPVKQKMFTMPFNVRKEIHEQIKDFLKRGIISNSNSPWAAPILLVRKSNGSWRFCCDYRKLNKVTVGDSHPLPKIEEIFAQLSSASIFSSLDLTSGFHQIQLDEESKKKTAFRSPFGLFEWNVLPFGINNAPVVFQRCMEAVFAAFLYDFVLIYIDDIVIFSDNFSDHLDHIEKVLDACISRNIVLNMKKSNFAVPSIDYLGYTVSQGHLEMNHEKIQGILEYPTPQSPSQISSFLGVVNFYRHFIDGFAAKTLCLNEAANADKFVWTDDCDEEFNKLKDMMSKEPVLTLPDLQKTFYLATDWSRYAIGAVLFQKHDGFDRPIAFFSRKTRGSELNYSSYDGELLAILDAVRRFRVYLLGKRFVLLTDHKTLTWMLTQSLEKSKYGRQLMELQQYEFDIHHISGTDNVVADALSRSYPSTESVSFSDMIQNFSKSETQTVAVGAMKTSLPAAKNHDDYFLLLDDFNKTNMQHEQMLDPFAGPILADYKGKGIFQTELDGFIVADGILYHLWSPSNSKGKVYLQTYLPEKFRSTCFVLFHENPWSGGHQGIDRTYYSIRTRFYWKGMYATISHWVRSCSVCQTHNAVVPRHGPFIAMDAYQVMDLISCDIVGPLEKTSDGNRFILVLTDYASKYVWTRASPNHTADTVGRLLIDTFLEFGCCTCFVSDQGAEFDADVVSAIFKILNVSSLRSTAYRPQSHGLVERVNRTLQTMLAKYVAENTNSWDEFLPFITSAYNTGLHSAIGVPPFSIMFSRDAKSAVDVVMSDPIDFTVDAKQIEKKTRKKMARFLADGAKTAYSTKKKHMDKMASRYDKSKKLHDFKIGDLVLRKIEKPASLGPKFLSDIYSIEDISMNAAKLKDVALDAY